MRHKTILVAEDSADDQLLLAEAVSEACPDCSLQAVENGKKAVDYLTGAEAFAERGRFPLPRLVLLDLKMPVKDGFETLEDIRKIEAFRFLPVVILSASSLERDIVRAYRLGANGYLSKPTEMSRLVEMMKVLSAFWLGFNLIPE